MIHIRVIVHAWFFLHTNDDDTHLVTNSIFWIDLDIYMSYRSLQRLSNLLQNLNILITKRNIVNIYKKL